MGSIDEGASVRGAGGGRAEEGEDEDDDLDEGELLGGEERGVTDTEAEKKNLAYAFFFPFPAEFFWGRPN